MIIYHNIPVPFTEKEKSLFLDYISKNRLKIGWETHRAILEYLEKRGLKCKKN